MRVEEATPNIPVLDCIQCNRDTRSLCAGFSWYAYKDIKFCRHQMKWLIENLELLEDGRWPAHPLVSGYLDSDIRSQQYGEPAVFRVIAIAGEVKARLKRTGEDGRDLVKGIKDRDLRLTDRAWLALRYISGWIQKRESYSQWKKISNYREKENKRMYVCSKCGGTRWQTKVKGKVWACRKCGTEKHAEAVAA